MKHTFKHILKEQRQRLQEDLHLTQSDFERISKNLSKRRVHLRGESLKKMWEVATGKRKLSQTALDRLALFAGFQDWSDLDDAIHGDVDASVNYEQTEQTSQAKSDARAENVKLLKK